MINVPNLTTYAIKWYIHFKTKDEFEVLWSSLMEAEIDCLTNVSKVTDENFWIYIFFKTIKDREAAQSLHVITK